MTEAFLKPALAYAAGQIPVPMVSLDRLYAFYQIPEHPDDDPDESNRYGALLRRIDAAKYEDRWSDDMRERYNLERRFQSWLSSRKSFSVNQDTVRAIRNQAEQVEGAKHQQLKTVTGSDLCATPTHWRVGRLIEAFTGTSAPLDEQTGEPAWNLRTIQKVKSVAPGVFGVWEEWIRAYQTRLAAERWLSRLANGLPAVEQFSPWPTNGCGVLLVPSLPDGATSLLSAIDGPGVRRVSFDARFKYAAVLAYRGASANAVQDALYDPAAGQSLPGTSERMAWWGSLKHAVLGWDRFYGLNHVILTESELVLLFVDATVSGVPYVFYDAFGRVVCSRPVP